MAVRIEQRDGFDGVTPPFAVHAVPDRTVCASSTSRKPGPASDRQPCATHGHGNDRVCAIRHNITPTACRIVLNGGARPMINGGPQAHVTGLPHDNDAALAATPGHRCDPAQTAQCVIISSTQGFPSLGEQRGEDDPSDSRQGPQDRHVALLWALPRFGFLGAGQLAAERDVPSRTGHELTSQVTSSGILTTAISFIFPMVRELRDQLGHSVGGRVL